MAPHCQWCVKPLFLTSHTLPMLYCFHPHRTITNALHVQRAISLAPRVASSLPFPVPWSLLYAERSL